MSTINEAIEQHIARLQTLSKQPVQDSARAAFEYALAAVMEIEWIDYLTEVPHKSYHLSVEEYTKLEPPPKESHPDGQMKIWLLDGRFTYLKRSDVLVALPLDAITANIEAAVVQQPVADDITQPLCALGLNLTAAAIPAVTGNETISSLDNFIKRARSFVSNGMLEGRPKQNLFFAK